MGVNKGESRGHFFTACHGFTTENGVEFFIDICAHRRERRGWVTVVRRNKASDTSGLDTSQIAARAC